MLPDAKWLEALKLPLRAMLGIALSSGALLLLDQLGMLDLGVFVPIVRPIVIAVCVVFSVLSLVGIVDLLLVPLRDERRQSRLSARRAVRRKEKEEQRADADREPEGPACLPGRGRYGAARGSPAAFSAQVLDPAGRRRMAG